MSHTGFHSGPDLDDDAFLQGLGYKPQLSRKMSRFGNFAISFSVISILSGCMTLYGFGMNTGGPSVMLWGWVCVGAMVMLVGAALAEVTSAYPTSGALFDMANRLGGPRWGYTTGWLNLLGLLGGIAGIDYGAAGFASAFASLQWDYTPTPGRTMIIFGGILVLHMALNFFGVRLVSVLNSISVWWHVFGVAVIAAALAMVPDQHQSTHFVFTTFVNNTGWGSHWYVAGIGLLLAQYTFCGYDASAHLSEETTQAQISAPRGIMHAIGWSWAAGFVLLAALTYAIQDYSGTLGTATGVPPAQIFLDALGVTGAKILLLIVIAAQLFCGNAEVAACSRMVFAFSRNGALPGSKLWVRVSARTGTPSAAVVLSVVVGGLLALPALWSTVAYGAVTAINIIGITPAYAVPIYLRLRAGDRFTPGPWNVGRFSKPIGWIAVVWVALVTVLFCLPQTKPATGGLLSVQTFNYAPVALAAALLLAMICWYAFARRTFQTPVVAGDRSDTFADEVV